MQITPLNLNYLSAWATLLATSFNHQPSQMRALLHFLQSESQLVAWGAWDGTILVAQYSCLLRNVTFPTLERSLPVGLSINMAVHPNYRGQGLVKQVAQPVYDALAAKGVAAGVGFSNAYGAQVDKRSSGYGYAVVGRLRPYLLWLRPQKQSADFKLTPEWPVLPFAPVEAGTAVQFNWTPSSLRHRFACHPFRNYQFGVWQQDGVVKGIVVFRKIRLGGRLPAVALLAIYGCDLSGLLQRWVGAMIEGGCRLVHLLTTPAAPALALLRDTAVCLPQPLSRTPYYLTVKRLNDLLPQTAFRFEKWACLGGDVL